MPDIVTAAQLAADLDANVKRLVRWLRAERERGHELLAGRPPGARWAFSREHGDRLAAEFTAAAARGVGSDSAVQRKAEGVIRDLLAEHLGVGLRPRGVKLAAGAPVNVDAVSDEGTVLAEIFARQGELKPGQQKKVAIDTLKLITIHRERPEAKLYIAFADKAASRFATGGGWVAQALSPSSQTTRPDNASRTVTLADHDASIRCRPSGVNSMPAPSPTSRPENRARSSRSGTPSTTISPLVLLAATSAFPEAIATEDECFWGGPVAMRRRAATSHNVMRLPSVARNVPSSLNRARNAAPIRKPGARRAMLGIEPDPAHASLARSSSDRRPSSPLPALVAHGTGYERGRFRALR